MGLSGLHTCNEFAKISVRLCTDLQNDRIFFKIVDEWSTCIASTLLLNGAIPVDGIFLPKTFDFLFKWHPLRWIQTFSSSNPLNLFFTIHI